MISQLMRIPNLTIGLDLGDRLSRVCGVDVAGTLVLDGTVATDREGLRRFFAAQPQARVVLEVGTHSPWVSRTLHELGHEVLVANPSAMYGGQRRRKRNDRMDAEFLARQGRADPRLLHPIQHRGVRAQEHLALLRARDQLVQVRTKLINHVRGAVKSSGARLPTCSADAFPRRVADAMPAGLQSALGPMIEVIAALSQQLAGYDRAIDGLIRCEYPEAKRLQQPAGVGPLTALAVVLLIDDPRRFAKSREVGAFFGLVPRLDESSASQPQLRISKAGDALGRRLLVNAAHYVLGPFGPDCDLRRHGMAIAARGGRNAKKRAVVAVARKLAVLLHRLWVSEQAYDPDRTARRRAA